MVNRPHIILASESPRRRYLLEQAGLEITVIPSHFDEDSIPITRPVSYVKALAEAKAQEIARQYPKHYVIGADTIVTIDDHFLGKPNDVDEAKAMLKRLNGQTHYVYSGFAILCMDREILFSKAVETKVQFKKLTDEEIDWYIQTGEPFDKAGAYAIQGIGTFLIRRIEGSYTNVVGLPVCEVIEVLIKMGVVTFNGNGPRGLTV